ncbi:MAG TPA: hypothetical protein DD734_03795 [Firmicutes bacterium]|nr:hypothetical protein [Bacillota bacterium]
MKKVNVLGTTYTVKERNEKSDSKLKECEGYCDPTIKVCVVDDMKDAEKNFSSKDDLNKFKKKVTRHELIHAFLYESGLGENSWAWNEEIVDWLAYQFPKLAQAFKEAGCFE